MKKLMVLTAVFCLCFQTIAVLAATPDYSGEWTLDVSKSKLPEQAKIESMTLKVSQSVKELTIETTVKKSAADGRGAMRRGSNGGGAQTAIFSLDGKEAVADIGSGIMAGSEARTAKVTADGKLSLTTTRKFKSEMGGGTTKFNETWELLDGGKALKIIRYVETPRGGINSEMYFTKKSSDDKIVSLDSVNTETAAIPKPVVPKQISGGTLNGKAKSMPSPEYPAAAKAVKAGGTVKVQVVIDEQGNIISASAISGHPLLRQAAEDAARLAKFEATSLSGIPVEVTGIIVYNFVP